MSSSANTDASSIFNLDPTKDDDTKDFIMIKERKTDDGRETTYFSP
jgi:hypothetical protein